MNRAPLITTLLLGVAAGTASADPLFQDPSLNQAYQDLASSAAGLAAVQNWYQQNGNGTAAQMIAPILAAANDALGQLVQGAPWINVSPIVPDLVNATNSEANRAYYYATADLTGPFQTNGEGPNPYADAAYESGRFNAAILQEWGQYDPGDGGDDPGDPGDGGWGDPGDGGGWGDPGDGGQPDDDDHC